LHGAEWDIAATADGDQQEHARTTYALSIALKQEAGALGDDYARLRWELDEGVRRLNTGELVGSAALLDRAVATAAALHDTSALGYALMRRGRLGVKRGDLPAARRDLSRSAELPPVSPAAAHEVQHNLFHLYEGLGDDARAEAAGLRFIRTTEAGGECAVRIVAYRDVALFYQRRGRIRDADRLFRQMVQSTDRQQREFLWAGEYFEMVGDLEESERYYRLEWQHGTSQLRAMPGLIRLAELRGDTGQARHWARLHDDWLPG
jgi:tetratricopeptide (TPR) repeat protein